MNAASRNLMRTFKFVNERLHDRVADQDVPVEYRDHRNLRLAFKRGFAMAVEARLVTLPFWYTGEDAKCAYRRGWNVGRAILSRAVREPEAP